MRDEMLEMGSHTVDSAFVGAHRAMTFRAPLLGVGHYQGIIDRDRRPLIAPLYLAVVGHMCLFLCAGNRRDSLTKSSARYVS
jgi:hypothetical protein